MKWIYGLLAVCLMFLVACDNETSTNTNKSNQDEKTSETNANKKKQRKKRRLRKIVVKKQKRTKIQIRIIMKLLITKMDRRKKFRLKKMLMVLNRIVIQGKVNLILRLIQKQEIVY